MKKIIKDGQREFHMLCSHCSCEYTYELPDIIGSTVYCPFCNSANYHILKSGIQSYNDLQSIEYINTNTSKYGYCETCIYYSNTSMSCLINKDVRNTITEDSKESIVCGYYKYNIIAK